MRALFLGLLASLFFASTFVLNRLMELAGGHWLWSASLRYLFMLVPLLAIVAWRGKLGLVLHELRQQPWQWMWWSSIGFGLFYAPLCFAAKYAPAWLVASTWQITIIAGALVAPLLQAKSAPNQAAWHWRSLAISGLILAGVAVIQLQHAATIGWREVLLGFMPVVIAAFAYPLGNRAMMQLCGQRLATFERVLGMTIASLPFWLILAGVAATTVGWPSASQLGQSLLVALLAGVIATVLFFKATDLAQHHQGQLAAVEATQAGEVVFALVGEIVVLNSPAPSDLTLVGIGVIIIGMVLHSWFSD
ncbi:DMT family transporter [Herpetosiphon geysericola]|uniref:Membrane protein n=1 Tax=Herpetosiphon geysericola TaxID=70996 RepID=A0A0P6XP70_9CHLR|nr:multidrug resistance efflux transporter family protein [Herpetosiphon geysericola]KPL81503.1 membrane protein [Herpetosiphon geysericola]